MPDGLMVHQSLNGQSDMILITGASKGIGKYLFERFIETEDVYGTYNFTKPDNKYADKYFQVDISNKESVINWIDSLNNLNKIILINCAGINYNSFAHKSDINKWENIIDVNLTGTFNVIHELLPYMRDQKFGRILNLSSVVSQMGVPGTSAYAASKSGLNGMIKSIAKENAGKGITINNLNLGYFEIGIIREVPVEMRESVKKNIPNGEFGNPKDIYKMINAVIQSPYVNGTSIDINGGLY